MITNTSFFQDFNPYFATLPTPDQVLTSELFTDDHIEELQSPELAKLVKRERIIADAVYYGIYKDEDSGRAYAPLQHALGDNAPTFQSFRYLTALITSREFGVHSPDGRHIGDYLVPGADMCNNNPERINIQQTNDGKFIYLVATKDIQPGEELFLPYLPGLDHRNDHTLAAYGFVRMLSVNDNRAFLLPATDLPTYDPEQPYAPTPDSDDEFYGAHGKFNTMEEHARLKSLLDGMETTIDEDARLLKQSSNTSDWRSDMIVKFRLKRKLALKKAMHTILKRIEEHNED